MVADLVVLRIYLHTCCERAANRASERTNEQTGRQVNSFYRYSFLTCQGSARRKARSLGEPKCVLTLTRLASDVLFPLYPRLSAPLTIRRQSSLMILNQIF